jgi:hypothetical protein
LRTWFGACTTRGARTPCTLSSARVTRTLLWPDLCLYSMQRVWSVAVCQAHISPLPGDGRHPCHQYCEPGAHTGPGPPVCTSGSQGPHRHAAVRGSWLEGPHTAAMTMGNPCAPAVQEAMTDRHGELFPVHCLGWGILGKLHEPIVVIVSGHSQVVKVAAGRVEPRGPGRKQGLRVGRGRSR